MGAPSASRAESRGAPLFSLKARPVYPELVGGSPPEAAPPAAGVLGPGLPPVRFLDFQPVPLGCADVLTLCVRDFYARGAAMSSDWIQSRKTLGALQASQSQAEVPQEPSPSNAPDMQPTIHEAGPVLGAGITGHSGNGLADAGHNLISWFQEPMGKLGAWRRVMRSFQAPIGS